MATDTSEEESGDWENVTAPLTEEQREKIFTYSCKGTAKKNTHGCFGKILNDNWEMTY